MKDNNDPFTVYEMSWLEKLTEAILFEKNEDVIEQKLLEFLQHYEVINYQLGYSGEIWRGRLCDSQDGYGNVNEISYPPKQKTKVGRLNSEKHPIFYASFNQFTALEEINVKEGDFVHMSGYNIKPESKLNGSIVGEFLKVHRGGLSTFSQEVGNEIINLLRAMSIEVAIPFVYMDAFLSSILRDSQASSKGYLHSRALGKLLFNYTSGLDAIFYPSVALENSMNLAIKTDTVDEKLEISSNCVVRINRKYKHGLYDLKIVNDSIGMHSDGTIIWGER